MADSSINVTLTANASQMAAELQKAQNELKDFEKQLRKASDVTEIQKLQASIVATKIKIDSLGKSNVQFARNTNTAAYALNDLSRIAQDAPYGFIGIQNNINPLLESFQRLKLETGSTGGALRGMIGALSGPAGLGLAVGAVSAAITFATVGFDRWYKSTKDSNEAIDGLQGSLIDLSRELKSIDSDLKSFENNLKDIQQIAALEFEIKSGKGYALDLFAAEQAVTSLRYKEAELNNDLAKAERILKNASDATFEFSKSQQGAFSSTNKFQNAFIGLGDLTTVSENQLKSFNEEQRSYIDVVIAAGKEVAKLRGEKEKLYNQEIIADRQLKLVSANEKRRIQDEINKQRARDSKKKPEETIDDVLRALQDSLADQQVFSGLFNESTLKKQFDLVKSTIEKLVSKFNLGPDDKRILELKVKLSSLQAKLAVEEFNKNLKEIKYEEPKIPAFQQKSIDAAKKKYDDYKKFLEKRNADVQKLMQDNADKINGIIEATIENIAVGFGEALGAALSGQGIGGFFVNIYKILGQGLQDIGQYMIQAAISIEAIKKFLIANPALAIAGGIALIGIGSALKSYFNQNAFAVGTRSAPGGMALVGERGPEMVNLPRGSQVIPAAQTAQMMGGLQSVEVFGMLRGEDIYFSNKKYGQTYGRLT